MSFKMLSILFTISCALSIPDFTKASIASIITKICRLDDSQCLKASAQATIPIFAAGIPEVGVESFNPARFDFIDCSKLNLKFILKDAIVNGLEDCTAIDVHYDADQSKMFVKLSCHIETHAQYELTGRVLALNVKGQGKIHSYLPRCEIATELNLKLVDGKDSKKHFNITEFKYTFQLFEKSSVVFENLFEGNKALSTAAAEVIKNSGNEIVREIGDPVFHASTLKVVKNINNLFEAIPYDELVIN